MNLTLKTCGCCRERSFDREFSPPHTVNVTRHLVARREEEQRAEQQLWLTTAAWLLRPLMPVAE